MENIVYVVQNLEGDILGIYEEAVDALARQKELNDDDGMETVLDDYILNVDVELIDRDEEPTTIYNDNVVEFKQ